MNIQAVLAGLISGLIGAMGLGGGGVLLIYLTVIAGVGQIAAQGINLIFFLPTGLLAVILYAASSKIEWKTVLKMWLGGAVGAALGFFFAKAVGTESLSRLFACFLIVFGLSQLFAGRDDAKKLSRNLL